MLTAISIWAYQLCGLLVDIFGTIEHEKMEKVHDFVP